MNDYVCHTDIQIHTQKKREPDQKGQKLDKCRSRKNENRCRIQFINRREIEKTHNCCTILKRKKRGRNATKTA